MKNINLTETVEKYFAGDCKIDLIFDFVDYSPEKKLSLQNYKEIWKKSDVDDLDSLLDEVENILIG